MNYNLNQNIQNQKDLWSNLVNKQQDMHTKMFTLTKGIVRLDKIVSKQDILLEKKAFDLMKHNYRTTVEFHVKKEWGDTEDFKNRLILI